MKSYGLGRIFLSYWTAVFVFFILLLPALYIFKFFRDQIQEAILHKNLLNAEATYRLLQSSSQEVFDRIFREHVSKREIYEILELALRGKEEEARTLLFRKLYREYEDLKGTETIWEFQFALPDNRSFLRLHAPSMHGDDLSSLKLPIVLANREKKPAAGFAVGRIFSGLRFAYPIITPEGRHLGAVEMSRPVNIFRKGFLRVAPHGDLILLTNGKLIEERTEKELVPRYYAPVPGLEGWYFEIEGPKPDEDVGGLITTCPLTNCLISPSEKLPLREEFRGLLPLLKERLRSVLSKEGNTSLLLEKEGRLYVVGVVKLYEYEGKEPAGLMLTFSRAKDMEAVQREFYFLSMLSFFGAGLFAFLVFLYIKQVRETTFAYRRIYTISASMGSGLFLLDEEGRIKFVNEAGAAMLGYTKEEMLGQVMHQLVHYHSGPIEDCPIYKAIKRREELSIDEVFVAKDGRKVDVHVSIRHILQKNLYEGTVVVVTDITERKIMEMELYRMATTDTLTGLYNRSHAMEEFKKAKERSDRYGEEFSLILMDADNFKKVNDTYGHEVGDKVLKAVAEVIKGNIRSADIPARWGGEEFLVILPYTGLEEARFVAERIRLEAERLKVGEVPKITLSSGVAYYRRGESIESLINRADKALYMAKKLGKNRVVSEDMLEGEEDKAERPL